jgi:N-acyl-L-homoserine lactone synthetase
VIIGMTDSVLSSSATELQLVTEQFALASSNDWLAEIREMRGRVTYEQGRRPSFRMIDGSFDDPDPIDHQAYHIIARAEGRIVGCARIVLTENSGPSAIVSTVGEHRFDRILRDIGTNPEQTCEASRWIVVPEYRGRLGSRIVAASWAVARWLSIEIAFVLAGTRQKQDRALIRMGARPVSGLPLFPSEVFDDDLRLLYFDVSHPPESMRTQMLEIATVLNLTLPSFPRFTHNEDAAKCF